MENQVLSLLEKRKASRAISTESLDSELIDQIMEAARLTPSCYNKQPWRFLFLQSADALEKGRNALVEPNRIWAERAPLLVVAYSRSEDDCVLPDGRAYHEFDLGMSVMNLMLAATESELIARPMAGFSPDKISESFGLEEGFKPLVVIAIGKPGEDESHLPERLLAMDEKPRQRKDPQDIISVL